MQLHKMNVRVSKQGIEHADDIELISVLSCKDLCQVIQVLIDFQLANLDVILVSEDRRAWHLSLKQLSEERIIEDTSDGLSLVELL